MKILSRNITKNKSVTLLKYPNAKTFGVPNNFQSYDLKMINELLKETEWKQINSIKH